MIKSLFLKTGELVLEKPLDVADLIERRPRLKKLQALLEGKFKKRGLADPAGAATKEIESFLTTSLGELGDAYVDGKGSLLKKLVKLQSEIHELYLQVMHGRGEVKLDLEGLRGRYREMQTVFDELGKNVEEVAASTKKPSTEAAVKAIDVEPTKVPAGKTVVPAHVRFGTLKLRKGFKAFVDILTGKSGWRAKLKSGVVEFFVEDGKLSVRSTENGKTTTFKEFDTLGKYKDKPLSTRVMQAHHGCQTKLMSVLFEDLYDPNEAPTIWLRDSTGDSPHGLITHAIQNPSETARIDTEGLSYGMIRDWAVGDLKAAGAPDEAIRGYLKAMDGYFDARIRPKLGPNAAKLSGAIKVY